MSAIKRFWLYWRGIFKSARGGFDISALILTVLLVAGCMVCKLVNFHGPARLFVADYKLADICGLGAVIVFGAWCMFRLPFRFHEAQEKAHQAEKQHLVTQLQQADALIKSVTEQKEKAAEPAGPKQKNKNALETYLTQLEDRVLTIKQMTSLEYNQNLKNGDDLESIDLLNEIYFFLDLNLGKTASANFKSRTGVTYSSINDWGQSAFKDDPWRGMVDNLNHFARQLRAIIKQQG